MATGEDHRTSIGQKGSARAGKAIPRCSHRRDHHVPPPGQGVHGDLYVPPRHRGPAWAKEFRPVTPNEVRLALAEVLGSGVYLNTSAFVIFMFGSFVGIALVAGA